MRINYKIVFGLFAIFLLGLENSYGQVSDSTNVKNDIYKIIINDINRNKPDYKIKQIYLDDKTTKFSSIDLFNLNVVLTNPDYVRDALICENLSNVKCVDQFEIDNYRLFKVFNDHKDVENPDFFGIYAPLDSWFQLVYQVVNNNFEKDKKIKSEIIIPVKNTYFKGEEIIYKTFFYKFYIDENFKLIDYNVISF